MNIFNQNRKLKWNISVMVILILLACSLMGLLTVIFLNSLISYTDDTYSYHKSYYIAKAWLELALTEIDNSTFWFSHNIDSGNIINTNFDCVGCNFTSRIQWRDTTISNKFWQSNECNDETALVLQAWQSITIPMFHDSSSSFAQIFGVNDNINLLWDWKELKLNCPGDCDNEILNIWVIFQELGLTGDISREYLYMTGISTINFFLNYFNNFNNIDNDYQTVWNNYTYYPYMIISNPNQVEIKFCINDSDNRERPTTKYFISSIWEYMWKTVWLQAIYAQPVPSFFINPYSEQYQ